MSGTIVGEGLCIRRVLANHMVPATDPCCVGECFVGPHIGHLDPLLKDMSHRVLPRAQGAWLHPFVIEGDAEVSHVSVLEHVLGQPISHSDIRHQYDTVNPYNIDLGLPQIDVLIRDSLVVDHSHSGKKPKWKIRHRCMPWFPSHEIKDDLFLLFPVVLVEHQLHLVVAQFDGLVSIFVHPFTMTDLWHPGSVLYVKKLQQ